ncbi:MAG: hypothetical protein U0556_19855 [Dehalococcoidia bacterium]
MNEQDETRDLTPRPPLLKGEGEEVERDGGDAAIAPSLSGAASEASGGEVSPDVVVEIRDEAIDVPAILAEVRAGLAARGYDAGEWSDLPVFGHDDTGDARWIERLRIDPEWAFMLDQIQEDARALTLHVDVRPSPLPVVGGLLTRFKRAAHELVVFYDNIQAARQRVVTGQTIAFLARVVAQQEAIRRDQRRLQEQIDALQSRLDDAGR